MRRAEVYSLKPLGIGAAAIKEVAVGTADAQESLEDFRPGVEATDKT
jgi:hypothetical protein